MNTTRKSRNPWPIAIVGYFIVFATFIAIFITWAVHQREDLVADNYYENEVRYQQQLDRMNRTQPLTGQITVNYNDAERSIVIALPAAHGQSVSGNIHLYRPSDARLDRDIPLTVNADGVQRVDAKQLLVGLWKVRVKWNVGGEEFFLDRSVIVTHSQS